MPKSDNDNDNDNDNTKKETHTMIIPAFRVKPSTHELITANTIAAGFSNRSAYLRHVGSYPKITMTQSKASDETTRQLLSIGNNLNQLTKIAHIRHLRDAELVHVNAVLNRLRMVLDTLL